MNERSLLDILTLRFAVGFLGEGSQHCWWPSGFLAQTAQPFLRPVFENALLLAQYHGVSEAARRVHDDRIGIGRVFHLFRLPEAIEHGLFERLMRSSRAPELIGCFGSVEAARAKLAQSARSTPEVSPGPVNIGGADTIVAPASIATLAAYYLKAFNAGVQCFPYFSTRA